MTLGILNDKWTNDAGRSFVKINDKPFEVPPFVITDLDEIDKGSTVDYIETNDIIRKITGKKKSVPTPRQSVFNTMPVKGNSGRNEKLIVMQHNFTVVSDLFIACHPMENLEFADSLKEIYRLTKEVTDLMMRDCHD